MLYFLRYLTWLGPLNRLRWALYHHVNGLSSYSQHGEDVLVSKYLDNYECNNSCYVDVGANHPTRISNTYLLYRNGFRGLLIEPNVELCYWLRMFRGKDIVLNIGCGSQVSLSLFKSYNIPVLGNFLNEESTVKGLHSEAKILSTKYLPILPLDCVFESFNYDFISFLSIDVEGMDYDVLIGGENTIKRCLLILIEANYESITDRIVKFLLARDFEILSHYGCNILFKNNSSFFQKFLKNY